MAHGDHIVSPTQKTIVYFRHGSLIPSLDDMEQGDASDGLQNTDLWESDPGILKPGPEVNSLVLPGVILSGEDGCYDMQARATNGIVLWLQKNGHPGRAAFLEDRQRLHETLGAPYDHF